MEFIAHIMAFASLTSNASYTLTSLAQNPATKLDILPLMSGNNMPFFQKT
jgi:hypothetical protein